MRCTACNRKLHSEESVSSGLGPCCAARIGRGLAKKSLGHQEPAEAFLTRPMRTCDWMQALKVAQNEMDFEPKLHASGFAWYGSGFRPSDDDIFHQCRPTSQLPKKFFLCLTRGNPSPSGKNIRYYETREEAIIDLEEAVASVASHKPSAFARQL